MESAEGVVRCNVDSMMRVIDVLQAAGIELINEGADTQGKGRGVRLVSREDSEE